MQFFNFQNAETFRYFKWLCNGNQDAISMVIEKALTPIEAPESLVPGTDPVLVTQKRLAEMLEESMEAMFFDWAGRRSDFGWTLRSDEAEGGLDAAQQDFLFLPTLIESLRKINYLCIAEALLIHWQPTEPPSKASQLGEVDINPTKSRKKATRPSPPKASRKKTKRSAVKTDGSLSRPKAAKRKTR